MTSLDLTTTLNAAKRSERLAQGTRVLCVLFFFSGFPALIYQLTWQRNLFLIFGVNIESVTIVVTAFMLGLGLGSLAGGWLSGRGGGISNTDSHTGMCLQTPSPLHSHSQVQSAEAGVADSAVRNAAARKCLLFIEWLLWNR